MDVNRCVPPLYLSANGNCCANASNLMCSSTFAPPNSLNGDKLTCLDVAVLMRNLRMVRLLQQYNAKESSACKLPQRAPLTLEI